MKKKQKTKTGKKTRIGKKVKAKLGKIKSRAKKHLSRAKHHVRRAVHLSRRAHRKLKTRVHPVIGWWSVSFAAIASLLILNSAFAQSLPATSTDAGVNPILSEVQENQAPPPASSTMPYRQEMPLLPPCGPDQPCPNNQPPQPGPGPQQQGQFGEDGQQERQQQMDQKRLESMKKGMSGMTREMNRVKAQVKSLQKKGVTAPEELTQALAKMDELVAKIKEAKEPEELEGVMGDIQETGQTIQEWMPKLYELAMWPQAVKQADRELAKAVRAVATDERRIKSAKMTDVLGSQLEEFRQAVEKQKALLEEAKQLVKTDPQEAMDKLKDDFFGNMDNMWENDKIIQISLNIRTGLSQMNREVKDAEKMIKTLKNKKIDTSELQQLIDESKGRFNEIKALAAAKPIDADALLDAVEGMMDIKQLFADKVQELTGDTGFNMPQAPMQNYRFNPPAQFMGQQGGPGPGSGIGF